MRACALSTTKPRVAIIGGGITGASAASVLIGSDLLTDGSINSNNEKNFIVDIFDQGRSGPGGRASRRRTEYVDEKDGETQKFPLQWDHGCQFFRADTSRMKNIVKKWTSLNLCYEWKGTFLSLPSRAEKNDFFGIPSQPPFYIWGGMHTLPYTLLNSFNEQTSSDLSIYSGTRVSNVEKRGTKWFLNGTEGKAAYHDTRNKFTNQTTSLPLGHEEGYDAIICTDVSSSFSAWHKASAGLPESFTKRVREMVGARVPLFSSLIAFDGKTGINASAIVFSHPNKVSNGDQCSEENKGPTKDTIWFAARSNSKNGMEDMEKECWTIISTPEYALQCIQDEPMQDPKTKEFRPQTKEYLLQKNENGPGHILEKAFLKHIKDELGGEIKLPNIIHRDAQRWGSAMPARKISSSLATNVMDVDYDLPSESLAPTKNLSTIQKSFIADDELGLYQAGDMVSSYTAGFEGAVLSGVDVAEHLRATLYPNEE